ncbi:MAG: anion transporter, partial [Rhodospirillaceae bacterium]|nr:anion transporter [Rhodospirillaceae bacterium]
VRLREQIRAQGPMKSADWVSIVAFAVVLSGWLTFSDTLGLGTVAIFGAVAFLVIGLVRWEDLNSGVNWGVVLLYAAAISLGVQMKDSGAALWVANNFLDLLSPLGIEGGIPLWTAVSALTTGVTNLMSNGAAVAVIGPITLKMAAAAGESPLLIGFITAISSAFAYLTVIGTPACTIVYASGYLKTTDFLRVGYRMVIVSTVLLIISAYLFWPLIGL